MAILKIEVVEGQPDIVYKNPYDQDVVFAGSPKQLKTPHNLIDCFVLKKDEAVNFRAAKFVYLAVPEHDIPTP